MNNTLLMFHDTIFYSSSSPPFLRYAAICLEALDGKVPTHSLEPPFYMFRFDLNLNLNSALLPAFPPVTKVLHQSVISLNPAK